MRSISEIAAQIGGRVVGDGNAVISGIRGIEEAQAGDLTFLANLKYKAALEKTSATAIIAAPGTECPGKNLILVEDPYAAFGQLLSVFHPEEHPEPGISPQAFVSENASIGEDVTISPFAYVGPSASIGNRTVIHSGVTVGDGVKIGADCVLHPQVTLYRRCIVGNRVILHAGVVIGSDGFGFAQPGRANLKIPQIGIVQIDDDVEIGANTTVDRATLGKTWIKRGAKIDNLVQIAHNVIVGEKAIIVSQVGISGSTTVGNSVVIGGQAGLVGHISIGDGTMIAAKSGVHEDVAPHQVVAGAPHQPHRDWLRTMATMTRLPDMRATLNDLVKRVAVLEKK